MIKLRVKYWMLAVIAFIVIVATYFSSQINSRTLTSTSQSLPSALAILDESNSSITEHLHRQQNVADWQDHKRDKLPSSSLSNIPSIRNSYNVEIEQSHSINNVQLNQISNTFNTLNETNQDVPLDIESMISDGEKTVNEFLINEPYLFTIRTTNPTTTTTTTTASHKSETKTKSTTVFASKSINNVSKLKSDSNNGNDKEKTNNLNNNNNDIKDSKDSKNNNGDNKDTKDKEKDKEKPNNTKTNNNNKISNISNISKINSNANNAKERGYQTRDLYEPGFSDNSSRLCPDQGVELRLMILIMSAPTHHKSRLAIRQTWGHYGRRRDVSIGFLIGTAQNQASEDQLSAENRMYDDIIRGQFVDSYDNLTLKTISMLEWVDTVCPKVSFVLKTDDDMFINVPRLLGFIEKHHNEKARIYGRLAKNWKPIRNPKSKYYVATYQYFGTLFPQFTTGPAYLLTSDIVHSLYKEALENTYLKLEDVYMTGIVASKLKIKRVDASEFLNRRIAFNQCSVKKAISLHMIKNDEQYTLWKMLSDADTKCKT